MFSSFFTKTVSGFLLVILLGSLYTPLLTEKAAPPAQAAAFHDSISNAREAAQDAIDFLEEKVQSVSGLATVANTANQLISANLIELKEFVLDGLVYFLAEVALRNITKSIVTWINSGFQGSPSFVTDLEGFVRNIADEEAGAFIYGSQLGFLCSPFELNVRIALATQYAQERDFQAQCTLSQVTDNIDGFINGSFAEGSWPAWFELTQDSRNTPQGAFYDAKNALDVKIRDAKGREIDLLNWGGGFLSFESCTEVQTARSGKTPTGGNEFRTNNKQNCTMTTPGSVIQEQLNETLTFGSQRLIVADEIDEIVGALMAQLSQQVLTGAFGLLGLGGSSYASTNFGQSGNVSYLDALVEEENAQQDEEIIRRVQTTLDVYEDFIAAQFEIVQKTSSQAPKLARAEAREDLVEDCFDLTLPRVFSEAQEDAEKAILEAEPLETKLLEVQEAYFSAQTRNEEIAVIKEITRLEQSRLLKNETDVLILEGFIDFELQPKIEDFDKAIAAEVTECLIPPERGREEEEAR